MHGSIIFSQIDGQGVGSMAGGMETARLPVEAGIGPHPSLPEPDVRLLPTVRAAGATGWPAGAAPTAAPGLAVRAFAAGLDHPRWLYVLPNGDVLVAETNARTAKPGAAVGAAPAGQPVAPAARTVGSRRPSGSGSEGCGPMPASTGNLAVSMQPAIETPARPAIRRKRMLACIEAPAMSECASLHAGGMQDGRSFHA